MKRALIVCGEALLCTAGLMVEFGCIHLKGSTPLEKQAYNVIVTAKAFLDAEVKMHPECYQSLGSPLCVKLAQSRSAKDLLIDMTEAYCAGPQFEAGGECQHPAKGTPAYEQAVAKVQAALDNYNRTAADLKGAL